MGIFYLKKNNLRPILEVTLYDPDGTVHDLTGQTVQLHIWLSDKTTKLTRNMVITNAAGGVCQYTWVAGDWADGNLIITPALPLKPGQRLHRMEYEATDGSGIPLTFPNNTWDDLQITEDAEP